MPLLEFVVKCLREGSSVGLRLQAQTLALDCLGSNRNPISCLLTLLVTRFSHL